MSVFDELHSQGQTIILVTHEDSVAAHTQRVITLRDGLVESDELAARGPQLVEVAGR